jgi:alkanesulfonate monooxygenase SsuD/methylene tetrahydromethanopterin reductase-like flavin-dependent oxidoreductase (luciferase family)
LIEIASPLAADAAREGWLAQNAAWIVGIVGIVVSGVAGPSVSAWWNGKREREKDMRAQAMAERADLRDVADEAAKALAGAISQLRPALVAKRDGQAFPAETRDFLGELFALGQRLQLRAGAGEPVVGTYESAREQLIEVSKATGSQGEFDAAAGVFEQRRAGFLEAVRLALRAPIDGEGTA